MSKNKHKNEEDIEQTLNEHIDEEQTEVAETADQQPDAAAEEAPEEAPKTCEQQLEEALEEVAQLKDKYLRQVAEFDNYRKRTLKEKAEIILNGGEKVLGALLPVLDDLERAQANMAKSEDVETLREGVDLIVDKLLKTLATQGLTAIDAAGQDFNTDFHEAIAMVPVDDPKQKGKVIDCVQTGYMLHEKVLRHAKVAVGQ